MTVLNMDVEDLKYYNKVTPKEALEFLQAGINVMFRQELRDFYNLESMDDFLKVERLHDNKICSLYEFYIE